VKKVPQSQYIVIVISRTYTCRKCKTKLYKYGRL